MDEKYENLRLVFQLAHDRNERLTSYVRVTDGAIWGFLGLAAVQLFNNCIKWESFSIPFFCFLLVISMYLWRNRVMLYNKDIIKGHIRMLICEHELGIPEGITIRENYYETLKENNSALKSKSYQELIDFLRSGKYKDNRHIFMNRIAFILGMLGIFVLFFWLDNNFLKTFYYLFVTLMGLGVLLLWGFHWRVYLNVCVDNSKK